MIILDTDHFTIAVDARQRSYGALKRRLESASDPELAVSIVTVEEQMRGWLAAINRYPDIRKQLAPYLRLADFIEVIKPWHVVPLNQAIVDRFMALKKHNLRIGTQDLKIASVALANDALLLTGNLRDFRQVPGLRVEDWTG